MKTKARLLAAILILFPIVWVYTTLMAAFATQLFTYGNVLLTFVVTAVSCTAFALARRWLGLFILAKTYNKGELSVFRDVIRYSGNNVPRDGLYLLGEVSAGEYERAISICTKLLSQKRWNRINRCRWLWLMARCYYELGDDQKLLAVCDAFDRVLLPDKNPERIRKIFYGMEYYRAFVQKDAQKCYALLEKERKDQGLAHAFYKDYDKARIAQDILGDLETARGLYALASAGPCEFAFVRQAQKGIAYRDGAAEVLPDQEVSLKPSREFLLHYLIMLPILVTASTLLAVLYITNADAIYDWRNQTALTSTLKQEYATVQELDILYLVENNKTIESMFVCVADQDVLVGSVYKNKDNKLLYQEQIRISTQSLKDPETVYRVVDLQSFSQRYLIKCGFFASADQIPANAYCVSEVGSDGSTVYFAVLGWMEIPQ